jgi:hypothetical protein
MLLDPSLIDDAMVSDTHGDSHPAGFKRASSDMVLSVHIPKTAGVSFRKILAQLYCEDFLLKYWQMTDAHGRVVASIPPNIRCIHGHYSPDVLLPAYPGARLITWVRDPVERVVSSYFHRLREPDWQHPVTRELHEKKLSLVEFAALELMRNEMARYFCGKSPGDFAFIGRMETFETSLARFLREFGFGRVAIPRENCNPERKTGRYLLDWETWRKIAAMNEQDLELYHYICRLDEQKSAA